MNDLLYVGPVDGHGLPNGNGRGSTSSRDFTYDGPYVGGHPVAGNAIITFQGNRYEGPVNEKGLPEGVGTLKLKSNDQVTGVFHAGVLDGAATLTYASGGTLAGRFSNGKFDADATYTDSNGHAQHVTVEADGTFKYRDRSNNQSGGGSKDGAQSVDVSHQRAIPSDHFTETRGGVTIDHGPRDTDFAH